MKRSADWTYFAFALLALNAIWAAFAPNLFNAVVAFAGFVALALAMARHSPTYVVAVSPLLFYWTTELLSGIAIEGGAFMVETDTSGSPTGAFSRLSLIYAVLLFAGSQLWRVAPADVRPDRIDLLTRGFAGESLILLASFALICTFFVFGVVNGFPLLEGIDRYAYRRGAGSDLLISFLDNRTIYFGLIGLAAASGRHQRAAVALFVAGIGISLLYGEKFTTIVEGFLFFFIPIVLQRLAEGRALPVRHLASAAVAVVVVTVLAILINYGALDSFEGAIAQLGARSTLQGQLWFLVDQHYGRLSAFDADSIAAALRSLYTLSEQAPTVAGTTHGMYYVMEPFTDAERLYWTMYAGGGFIFAHFPYWLMVSGYIGALVMGLLTVLLLSMVSKRVALALLCRDPISLVIWLKVLVWIYAGFVIGNLWFFFGLKALVLMFAGYSWDTLAAAHKKRHDHDANPGLQRYAAGH